MILNEPILLQNFSYYIHIHRVILNEPIYLQIFSYYMHIHRMILNEPTYLPNFLLLYVYIEGDS